MTAQVFHREALRLLAEASHLSHELKVERWRTTWEDIALDAELRAAGAHAMSWHDHETMAKMLSCPALWKDLLKSGCAQHVLSALTTYIKRPRMATPAPAPAPSPATAQVPAPAGLATIHPLAVGLSETELLSWLDQHGLADLRQSDFAYEVRAGSGWGRNLTQVYQAGIIQLYLGTSPTPGKVNRNADLLDLHNLVRKHMLEQAQRVGEREAQPLPPIRPGLPIEVRQLCKRLDEEIEGHGPRLQLREHPQQGAWVADGVQKTLRSPLPVPETCTLQSAMGQIRVDLATHLPLISCSCPRARTGICNAALALARNLRRQLTGPDSAKRQHLFDVICRPSWDFLLERLPVGPAEAQPRIKHTPAILMHPRPPHELSVCWMVPGKNGSLKLQLISAGEAAVLPQPERTVHALIGDAGRAITPSVRHSVLELLEGYGRFYVGTPSKAQQVDIQVQEGRLATRALPDGAHALALRVGDHFLDPRSVASADDRMMVLPEGEPVVILARLSQLLRQTAGALPAEMTSVPAEAVPRLAQRLIQASASLPVDLSTLPIAEQREAELRPVAVIERTGAGYSLRLGSRPHPSLPLLELGDGKAELAVVEDEKIIQIRRNMEAEESTRWDLVARVGLPEQGGPTWQLPLGHSTLEILLRLRELQPELDLEWSQAPPRIQRLDRNSALKVEMGAQSDWFGLSGTATGTLGPVSLALVLQAIREKRDWVRVDDDTWARVDEELRERLARLAATARTVRGQEQVSPLAVDALEDLAHSGAELHGAAAWLDRMERMREATTLEAELPAGVQAELRPYQLAGYRWIMRLAAWADGAVLADDMGLGKTLQSLCTLAARAHLGPALVVAPTSVGFNWQREARTFTPALRVRLMRGADRRLDVQALGPGDVVITSYELLARDQDRLSRRWATLVLDEAHAIKNAQTQRARAAAEVEADFRLALTGTPVENRLSELWSLMSVVLPPLLGPWEHFRDRYIKPIELSRDTEARQALAGLIRPFLLRRTKSEVARDLPPRSEVRIDVELSPAERKRYEAVRRASLATLTGLDSHTPPEQRRFLILAALTRLRQLASHPRLVDPAAPAESAKLTALLEHCETLLGEGRRALIFSQFTSHLDLVEAALVERGRQLLRLDGSTPEKARRDIVARFQAGEAELLLLSLRAGGVGLNLTAATDVVLLDPWWNPAVEDQAADRAHRIGQTSAVTIWRLVARETVEEQMLALHQSKRDLVAGVLEGTGESGALTVEELMALVSAD